MPSERGGGVDLWEKYTGKVVVVDTDSSYLYLGTLTEVAENFVHLADVDVHDKNETPTTKEKYVLDAKRLGVRPNRKDVAVRTAVIVSLSLLEDVIEY